MKPIKSRASLIEQFAKRSLQSALLAFAVLGGSSSIRGVAAPPETAPAPKGDAPTFAPAAKPQQTPHIVPRSRNGDRTRFDEDSPDRPPLAFDRQTIRQLESAAEAIGKKDFVAAMHQYQHVLDSPEDSWIQNGAPQGPKFESARKQASDGIGRLPFAARESYETEFGPVARRMLEDASTRNDSVTLAEIVRRYFHTRAGREAAYLLGNRLLDASMPLAAAAQFDSLRNAFGSISFEPMLSLKAAYCWMRAGNPQKSLPILLDLKRHAAAPSMKIRGQNISLFNRDADALQWLTQVMKPATSVPVSASPNWPLFGGSPERNAESTEALPLGDPVWTESVIRDRGLAGKDRFPMIEAALNEYARDMDSIGVLTIPGTEPVVVGNTLVFRTLARLRAVDARTGAPQWDFAERDRLYGILALDKYPSRSEHRLALTLDSNQDELRLFLNSRSFRDMTYGGLSSDGQRVFAILEPGFLGQEEGRMGPRAEFVGARNHNILAAID